MSQYVSGQGTRKISLIFLYFLFLNLLNIMIDNFFINNAVVIHKTNAPVLVPRVINIVRLLGNIIVVAKHLCIEGATPTNSAEHAHTLSRRQF